MKESSVEQNPLSAVKPVNDAVHGMKDSLIGHTMAVGTTIALAFLASIDRMVQLDITDKLTKTGVLIYSLPALIVTAMLTVSLLNAWRSFRRLRDSAEKSVDLYVKRALNVK